MKAGLLIAALSAVAIAQPHRRHIHKKRDTEVVTDIVYVNAPNVYVYVDADGNPTSTSTEGHGNAAPATPAPVNAQGKAYGGFHHGPGQYNQPAASSQAADAAPVAASSTSSANVDVAPVAATTDNVVAAPAASPYAASSNNDNVAPAATSTSSAYVAPPAPVPTSSSSVYVAPPAPASTEQAQTTPADHTPDSYSTTSQAAPAATSQAPSYGGGSSGLGIAYSPYVGGGGCKTQDQINTDLAKLGEYSHIRLYGTDCDQVAMVMKGAPNAKIFAGIFDITDIKGSVDSISKAVNGDWSQIDTVSVGNELVNNAALQTVEAGVVAAAVIDAKARLRSAGYTGPVVTVDTFIAIINNKGVMCNIGDYVAANAHPFFDGNVAADGAGDWVKEQVQRLSTACPGKKIVITETGWPWKGTSNNKAVPGTDEQKKATDSIKSAVPSDLYMFTAFNDMWKVSAAATFDAEQYWGMYGYASCDAGKY